MFPWAKEKRNVREFLNAYLLTQFFSHHFYHHHLWRTVIWIIYAQRSAATTFARRLALFRAFVYVKFHTIGIRDSDTTRLELAFRGLQRKPVAVSPSALDSRQRPRRGLCRALSVCIFAKAAQILEATRRVQQWWWIKPILFQEGCISTIVLPRISVWFFEGRKEGYRC